MSDRQREAVVVGMPKVHAVFEAVGFPNLRGREEKGTIMKPMSGVLPTVYFAEFATPGRNFGTYIKLLETSEGEIFRIVKEAIDSSVVAICGKEHADRHDEFMGNFRARVAEAQANEDTPGPPDLDLVD